MAAGSEPLAMAYAGHQFGNFVPQLGDGRAVLLGEVIDRHGRRRDIQLKGSGPTPFSRQGDGRAALGPVLREYIVSEAMAALGIPTTRALAAMATGETIWRETIQPGGVLTRVAASHIRVGTFQYFAAQGDIDGMRALADHAMARHDPEAAGAENPYRAFLDGVIARQAELIAQWLLVGFIHGVMNTDNMAVVRRDDRLRSLRVHGRLSSGEGVQLHRSQAAAMPMPTSRASRQWNLARLAETLLPLLGDTEEAALAEAQAAIDGFAPQFERAYEAAMRRKLGLFAAKPDDMALAQDLLKLMADDGADFTLTFRQLCEAAADPAGDEPLRAQFADLAAFGAWASRWRARLAEEPQDANARRDAMRAANPAFIPRNHRIEEAIAAAVDRDDFTPVRDAGDGAGQAVRRSAGICRLCRRAPARRNRAADLLRHVSHACVRAWDLRVYARGRWPAAGPA